MIPEKRLRVRALTVYALLGALMFILKMALAPLPNIEPVSLLVITYTLVFGREALWPVYAYVSLECLVWGIGLWNLNYLYVWGVLYLLTRLFRRMSSSLGWAVLSGAFGLFFGLLCAPVYLFTGGWAFAVSWWISGIPYDLLHCAGNLIAALVLLRPCCRVLEKLKCSYLRKQPGRSSANKPERF